MRTINAENRKKRMDFGEIARMSVRKQMNTPRQEAPRPPEMANIRQVIFVGENSCYFRQRHFFLGKYVRILSKSEYGGYFVEFCKEEDRQALNMSEGWKYKKEYLLDCAKFK